MIAQIDDLANANNGMGYTVDVGVPLWPRRGRNAPRPSRWQERRVPAGRRSKLHTGVGQRTGIKDGSGGRARRFVNTGCAG